MDIVVDGKPLTAADVLRLGRQLEAAMELEEVAAIEATAEAWARAFSASRLSTHNELVGVAQRAKLVLAGKPREAGTFAPAAWPEVEPPAIRPVDVARIADAHGLGSRAAELVAGMQPSLLLWPIPTDTWELPAGATRLGGVPDVPTAWTWPRSGGFPLSFLGQIRLDDVAQALPGQGGPADGLLQFFFDADGGVNAPSAGGWQVAYIPSGLELTPAAYPADLYPMLRFSPAALALLPDLTMAWRDGAMQAFSEALPGAREGLSIHRMFGQHEARNGDVLADGEVLLLQLDTDSRLASPPNDGFYWGNGGPLYFTMPRADWEAGHFDNVKAQIRP